MEVFKVNSSLLQANGLEEKVYKILVLKLFQSLESDDCWLCPRGEKQVFEQTNFQFSKVQMPGGCRYRSQPFFASLDAARKSSSMGMRKRCFDGYHVEGEILS